MSSLQEFSQTGFHSNLPVLALIPTLSATSKAPFDHLAPTPIHDLPVDQFRTDMLSAKGLDEGEKHSGEKKHDERRKYTHTHTHNRSLLRVKTFSRHCPL